MTPGAGVPADDVIAGREGSLSAWKTQARSFLLLDKPQTPACGAHGRAGPGAPPCCCAVCPWTSHLPSLGFLMGPRALQAPAVDSLTSSHSRSPGSAGSGREAGVPQKAVISGSQLPPQLPLLVRKSSGDGWPSSRALWPVPVLEAGCAWGLEPPALPHSRAVASEELPNVSALELPQEAVEELGGTEGTPGCRPSWPVTRSRSLNLHPGFGAARL